MKRQLLIFLFVIIPSLIYAGETPLRFSYLSDKNGLPHNFTFSIVQDDIGFIWIGTNNGLARFDGYSFKIYQPNDLKPNSLAKKPANLLFIDSKKNLWINFRGIGVNKLDLQTEKFTYYSPENISKHYISGTQIRKFYEDQDSVLWVASEKGILRYDHNSDSFISVLPANINKTSIPNNNIYNLIKDRHGNLWFRSSLGIGFFNIKKNKVISLGTLISKPEIDKISFTSIIYDDSENIWLSGQNNGVLCYSIPNKTITTWFTDIPNIVNMYQDKNKNLYFYADTPNYSLFVIEKSPTFNGKYKKFSLNSNQNSVSTVRFTEDHSGNIWIGSYNGLEKYSPISGVTHLKGDPIVPNSLINDEIESLMVDNTNNLWLCMYRKGINKADLKQKPFRCHYSHPVKRTESISGNIVNAIYQDKNGLIWIGCTGDGLTCYNPTLNSYKKIPLVSTSKISKFPFTAITEDSAGYIWIGYTDNYLDKLDPKTYKTTRFSSAYKNSSPYFFRGRGVRKIIVDKEGNLWMASMIGIIEYKTKAHTFIYHSILYEDKQELNTFYRTIFIDKEGLIWAGSNTAGLIRYDKKTNQFQHFLHKKNIESTISSNTVYSIYEDNADILWIGTSSGLNCFNKKNSTFTPIAKKQGLSQYSILSIIPDSHNHLWMSTDNGIIRFNRSDSSCTSYKESDGLPSNDFSTTASFISKEGIIFYGSPNGMVSFKPDEIRPNPYPAKPIITNLLLFNEEINPVDTINGHIILKERIASTKSITLHYNENDITLEFSALHYASPDKIKYFYKLEGFNDSWITTGANRRFVSYTGLQPGNYLFRLKATNNDGIQLNPNEETQLEIVILPPFWKTTLFYVLLILLCILFIVLFIRVRMIHFRRLNSQLEQKVKERTTDLREINLQLEERQEEIYLQKEELEAQKDTLEQTNNLLKIQQEQILDQNAELDKHRNDLKVLVEERTRELEKALFKAEESDKLKSAFLANMSHEIRTPMNSILGFSNLLLDNTITDEEKESYISIIRKSGESLMVLINDIIDISLIQSNQMEIQKTTVTISSILDELFKIFSLETKNRNLILNLNKTKINEDLQICTDSIRFKQIFYNLLVNAIKFTQKGSIEFGIYDINTDITFYVRDTGVGIPLNTGDAIFERFTKLEKNKDKLFGGTGLGLAITKSLINLLGGKIWYESVPNKGTAFYFTHPLTQKKTIIQVKNEDDDSRIIEIPDLQNKIILIAEDEEFNYKLLYCFLQGTNATILWAINGEKTIELALNNNIDLILMDIKMPVLSGIEASKKIKLVKPELPIIAQTAFAYKNEIESLIKAGIDGYIIKPIKQYELLKIVKKFLS